ncbi:hypothetical protein [Micromonospora sp. NPDC050495]|uniref:alpha/beta hydrolase family protein n=1 Tax=Micromonospora sp. NPDC050495 TaxID=3154936 RepID=UPI0033FE377C
MRPLEIMLVITNLLVLAALTVPLPGRTGRVRRAAPPLALLVMAAQLLVEGQRWQMVPAYALSAIFFVAWLVRTVAPARAARRGRIGRLGAILGVGLGVLGLMVSTAVPLLVPVFSLPRPTGPYDVGTVTYHWIDPDRGEIFTADPNDRRELMVQVWYPAKANSPGKRAPYVSDSEALVPLARLMKLPSFTFSHLEHVTTNAILSAPMADGAPTFPVLLFSHGRSGFRQHNTRQVEELASHGYIIATIDHPYAAAGVVFPDGRLVTIDNRLLPPWPRKVAAGADPAFQAGILPYLAQDALFTLNQLGAVNKADPQGILTGRLDLDRAAMFGASMGGLVTAEACRLEPRLRACLVLDVFFPADVVRSGLRQPTMWISRDAETMRLEGWDPEEVDLTQATAQAVYEKLPADGYLVRIPGMFHANISDAALYSPLFSSIGVTGPIDGRRAQEIIAEYSLAFFDRHVKGQPGALLDGPPQQYPEVIFETRRS